MQTLRFFFMCVSVAALSACNTARTFSSASYDDHRDALKLSDGAMAIVQQKTGTNLQTGSLDELQVALVGHDETTKGVVKALITVSDAACDTRMAEVTGADKEISATLNLSGYIFAQLVPFFDRGDTAQILGGASALAQGSEEQLRKALIDNKSGMILDIALRSHRIRERENLLTQLQKNVPPQDVLAKVAMYHSDCGVNAALDAITKAVKDAESSAAQNGADDAEAVRIERGL